MLGSIGEELAMAICHSGWAKPAVSEVGLKKKREKSSACVDQNSNEVYDSNFQTYFFIFSECQCERFYFHFDGDCC